MFGYVLRRVLAAVPVMALVGVLVFSLLQLTPGDPATVLAGDYASAEQVAAIRAQLGLDQPVLTQFMHWAGHILRGDLGQSIYSNQPVARLIAQRVEPTLMLSLCTVVLAVAAAVPLGVLAAYRAGGGIDRLVMSVAVAGYSTPVFVVGYALVYVFALGLGMALHFVCLPVVHWSNAWSSAQEEKLWFGRSPHDGTPRTRTASAFTGSVRCSVNAWPRFKFAGLVAVVAG